MHEHSIKINIESTEEQPLFIVYETVDMELRIRFVHNFEEAVKYSDKYVKIKKDEKLTVTLTGQFPDNFVEGV